MAARNRKRKQAGAPPVGAPKGNKPKGNKPKGNKPKGKTPKPGTGIKRSTVQRFRYGTGVADPYQTMRTAKPKQRRAIRKAARARGSTVPSYMSGGPSALQEKSNAGLARQATKTVNAAYKPEYKEIGDQEKRALNLDSKREQDERYYQQWLAARTNEQEATAQAADGAILGAQQTQRDALAAAYQQTEDEGKAAAAGAPGGDTQLGVSGALETDAESAYAQNLQVASNERTQSQMITAGALRSAFAQSNIAFGQGRRLAQQGALDDALERLGDDRKTLGLRRAGDAAQEISRLRDLEVTKAQNTRDFGAAAKKLGIDAFEARTTARDKRENRKEERKQNRIENRLKQIALQLEARDLGRKEREVLIDERVELLKEQGRNTREAAGNRQSDINNRRSTADDPKSGKGSGAVEMSAFANKMLKSMVSAALESKKPSKSMKQHPLLMKAAAYRADSEAIPPALRKALRRKYPRGSSGNAANPAAR